MDEPIDRNKVKDPSEVSGWGRDKDGHPKQDFSDIARRSSINPEAMPENERKSPPPKPSR